jgi:hypothetical protein
MADDEQQGRADKIAGIVPVWVANFWIAGVLAWFFVIRILGSGTAQHLLSKLKLHRGG